MIERHNETEVLIFDHDNRDTQWCKSSDVTALEQSAAQMAEALEKLQKTSNAAYSQLLFDLGKQCTCNSRNGIICSLHGAVKQGEDARTAYREAVK